MTGSAAAGASALDSPRGRPNGRHLYPIFPCPDGHVRICVLSARQWRGMLAWLGTPEELSDPSFDHIMTRFTQWPLIHGYIERLFAEQPAAELVAAGQQLGVPVARLFTPAEVLRNEHFDGRGAFVDIDLGAAGVGRMPSGYVEVNGTRAGYRTSAPRLGEHTWDVVQDWTTSGARVSDPRIAVDLPGRSAPLAPLRVLDLGVIVAGAESGRLFADQGADVIKVENKGFPDGGRQSLAGEAITPSFVQGHRGKRGLGLDLRSQEGKDVFLHLVKDTDVVLSNFKPGTMESLGLGYDTLRQINPRLVMVDSSALGRTGPWAKTLGYGRLVRASSSLTSLWRYHDVDESFSDAVTHLPGPPGRASRRRGRPRAADRAPAHRRRRQRQRLAGRNDPHRHVAPVPAGVPAARLVPGPVAANRHRRGTGRLPVRRRRRVVRNRRPGRRRLPRPMHGSVASDVAHRIGETGA